MLLSVCVSVTIMNPAKTDELIEYAAESRLARNHLLDSAT